MGKIAGVLIAAALIFLGVRFLFGKGLPGKLLDKLDDNK